LLFSLTTAIKKTTQNIKGMINNIRTMGTKTPLHNSPLIGVLRETRLFHMIKWCPAIVAVLIISFFLPTEFSFTVGGLRLSPYRFVLIAVFIPCLIKLGKRNVPKFGLIDTLIISHLVWSFMSLVVHHDISIAIESGGIRFLELAGAFLVARTLIIDPKTFRGTFALLTLLVIFLAPITLLETFTGNHLIKNIASALSGKNFASSIDTRFGFHRAYGPFDHPILYGVFVASLFGITWFDPSRLYNRKSKNKFRMVIIFVAACTSVSSGAIASLMTQLILSFWEFFTRKVAHRWLKLFLIWLSIYLVIDLISNRSGMKVLLSYLTFSEGTAYFRVLIFDYGIQEVWRHPIFGIGFNDWIRPAWMHSGSMDNFWLLQAVTFGIPAFITIALPTILLLAKNWKNFPKELHSLRVGWNISLFGLVLAACTVHLWNSLFVYFGFFLGTGMWFLTPPKKEAIMSSNKSNFLASS